MTHDMTSFQKLIIIIQAYSLRGKGGTDQLTKTLAGYIGPLAECILQAEGDILKYAGDAFIAYWKTGGEDFPQRWVFLKKLILLSFLIQAVRNVAI